MADKTPASHRSRIQALDALRAVAVLGVFAFHTAQAPLIASWLPTSLGTAFAFGMFGVDLFYVLSGFFITSAILRASPWTAGDFLMARVRRIYPAYLVCLFATMLWSLFQSAQAMSKIAVGFVLHLLMLQNLIPGVPALFNAVFWTLGVEFPYYLLMLSLAPLLRSANYFLPTTAAMILTALVFKAGIFMFVPLDGMSGLARFFGTTQILGALDTFALGGLAAWIVQRMPAHDTIERYRQRRIFLILGLICLSLSMAYVASHAADFWSDFFTVVVWRAILATGFAALVISCTGLQNHALLRWTGLPWLGKISFSFYLWHYPVVMSLEKLQLTTPTWVKLLYVVTLSLTVSWASWRFIETRFHRTAVP